MLRHLPKLKINRMSLGMLGFIGCVYGGSVGNFEIKKDKVVFVGFKINGLFLVKDVEWFNLLSLLLMQTLVNETCGTKYCSFCTDKVYCPKITPMI